MSKAVHPKTAGAGTGAALGVVITAILTAAHVHVTPELAGAISAITGALGAAVKKPPAPEPKPHKHKARPSPQLTMFDAIDVGEIPGDAKAVAGYVDGHWPTYHLLRLRFPRAYRLSIAVFPWHDAHCLDVEQGDATPEQAAAWVKRQRERGYKRPVIYASVAVMPRVLGLLRQAGISRSEVRLLTAHYGRGPHLCGPSCGFGFGTHADATQWTDTARGRNLDESLVARGFWQG